MENPVRGQSDRPVCADMLDHQVSTSLRTGLGRFLRLGNPQQVTRVIHLEQTVLERAISERAIGWQGLQFLTGLIRLCGGVQNHKRKIANRHIAELRSRYYGPLNLRDGRAIAAFERLQSQSERLRDLGVNVRVRLTRIDQQTYCLAICGRHVDAGKSRAVE